MEFKLDATMTDEEYFLFRKFATVQYGKKSRRLARMSACLVIFMVMWLFFRAEGLTAASISCGICLSLWLIISQILFKPFCIWQTKRSVESLKKKGKRLYSEWCLMEFYDDYFCDVTEKIKYEVKYSAIESVSVIENKLIVLNADNGTAFMLPVRAFENKEQSDDFLNFIKTKCAKIDFYEKI